MFSCGSLLSTSTDEVVNQSLSQWASKDQFLSLTCISLNLITICLTSTHTLLWITSRAASSWNENKHICLYFLNIKSNQQWHKCYMRMSNWNENSNLTAFVSAFPEQKKKKKERGSVTFLSNRYKQPRGLGLRNNVLQLKLTYEWVLLKEKIRGKCFGEVSKFSLYVLPASGVQCWLVLGTVQETSRRVRGKKWKGGGEGVKLHGPASHYPTPGGGVYSRSLKATRTKISSGSTGHLARCPHGFTFNKRYCPPRRLEFKVN